MITTVCEMIYIELRLENGVGCFCVGCSSSYMGSNAILEDVRDRAGISSAKMRMLAAALCSKYLLRGCIHAGASFVSK